MPRLLINKTFIMNTLKKYTSNLNYIDSISNLSFTIKETLRDIPAIPTFNSNIFYDLNETLDLSDKFMVAANTEDTNKNKNKIKYYNKAKLKYNILKNISNHKNNKSRSYALYYYENMDKYDYIGYYIDYKNDYEILTNIDDIYNESNKDFIIKLSSELSNRDIQNQLITEAENVYLGLRIFHKYHFIDIMVFCCILILILLLQSLKTYLNIYISGIFLLLIVFLMVCITLFFYDFKK